MKVVIDTNVLVSAAIRDRGPERVILFVAETPEFEWIVSAEILSEYAEVLARPKFGLTPELLDSWASALAALTTIVKVEGDVDFPRDRRDEKFLSCAISSAADFLITGDRDFEEAQRFHSTTVVSVAMFEKNVCKVWYRR